MRVLGVETSCDETAVAVYDSEQGLLAHQIYSQITTHAQFGGVVPELASRDHIKKTLPLIEAALNSINLLKSGINGIAYTKGPGLIGALMVGATIARSLGWVLNVPTLGIHHLESHLMAVMLETHRPSFPFIALLVSGGHTLLIEVRALGNYILLGETVDDAVGEAFDKTAKLLGLSYPGGPALALLAEKGHAGRFNFPRPLIQNPGLNFSFSGLKTAVATCYRAVENDCDDQTRADIALAFEDAVVDTLVIKCQRALAQTKIYSLAVVGGVGANKKLRARLQKEIFSKGGEVYFPRTEFCTDNGAMVAYTGYLRLSRGEHDGLAIEARARWPITDI